MSSIGVIGGADGPTAIFITVIAGVVFLVRKHRKKK